MLKFIKRCPGRPKKKRFIDNDPKINQFSPRGRPGRPDEVIIEIDQFETLRLSDHQGLSQQEASKIMKISQQTFSRILKRARKSMADALVNGKTIYIQENPSHASTETSLTEKTAEPSFHKLLEDSKDYLIKK
jgi:hypothetical protein